MSKDTGGPAFPSCVQYFPEDTNYDENQGMTLRDYFAAKAMQGLMSGNSTNPLQIGQASYIIADAMLAERAK